MVHEYTFSMYQFLRTCINSHNCIIYVRGIGQKIQWKGLCILINYIGVSSAKANVTFGETKVDTLLIFVSFSPLNHIKSTNLTTGNNNATINWKFPKHRCNCFVD